jgi:hypothetical protein
MWAQNDLSLDWESLTKMGGLLTMSSYHPWNGDHLTALPDSHS